MRSSLQLLCVAACVCLCTGTTRSQRTHSRALQLPKDDLNSLRLARLTSNTLGVMEPQHPPVRITNAHSGVDESVILRSRRRQRLSSPTSPQANNKPRSKRRLRRRRLQSRRPGSRRLVNRQSVQVNKPVEEPKTNHRFARKIVEGTLYNVRGGARLIGARGNYGNVPLVNKLIDNATLIRENIVDGFDCKDRRYGYYADQLNDCQVFHICVPMKQIFPDHFTDKDVYHFSFICPKYTIFSQDAMVCAWKGNAVPCEEAHNLYYMNGNFFVVSNDDVKKETAVTGSTGGGYPGTVSVAPAKPIITGGGYPSPSGANPLAPSPIPLPTSTKAPAPVPVIGGGGYPVPGASELPTAPAPGPLPDSTVIEEQIS